MMPAAHCVLSGAVHESCSQRSGPPAIEFPKLGCVGIQIGLEVGVKLCSQGTRGSSLTLLQGRFTLDSRGKSMENMVQAAQGRGRVPSSGGGTWGSVGMLQFGRSCDSSWGPFSNLKILAGQRCCWVALLGFGADCKYAALGISGRERGNTKEIWG